MEFKKFKFEPEDGFLNSSYYEDTPENAREILQRQHNQTRDYINDVTKILNSKKEGESGSESIKSPDIPGVFGDNVYLQLKDIKRQLNETVIDKVPDGSITKEKLANESVGGDKLENGSITKEKFAPGVSVPLADDTLNINGVPSEEYLPMNKIGGVTLFKDFVGTTGMKSLKGKTHNGKRYIIQDGYLHALDIEKGEIKRASDVFLEQGSRFAVFGDDNIIIAKYSLDGDIYFYRIDEEYKELSLIKNINLNLTGPEYYSLFDIDCDGENIYLGIYHNFQGHPVNDLYKIKISELENTDKVESSCSFDENLSGMFFCAGKDVVWSNKILRNGQGVESIKLSGVPISYDKGCLLMKDCLCVIVNSETFIPVVVSDNLINSDNVFLYNGYLYRQFGDYLFRTKLI